VTTDRLTFNRESERRTSDEKLRDQLDFIATRALSGNRGRGWSYELGPIEAQSLMGWTFSAWIRFYRTREVDPEKEQRKREEIYEFAAAAGHHARFGSKPWTTAQLGKERKVEAPNNGIEVPPDDDATVPLASISTIQQDGYFDHLYGLDAQIRIMLSAVQAAADSNMCNRFHTLMWGPPGTGKTDILVSTSQLLNQMFVSHLMIDATSTTEAGMRKALMDEDAILPEVIIVEEIEKAKHSFHLLLGLMDDRATVTQMNFRRTETRKVPALILASANDYELLRKTESGALLSRFSNEIYCPRPGREILAKILEREIRKVKGGREEWIEPTLEFCYNQRRITDPRMLKRVCLCGKDRLINGEYQRDLEETMKRVPGGSGLIDAFD
jgi:hypothetical protein